MQMNLELNGAYNGESVSSRARIEDVSSEALPRARHPDKKKPHVSDNSSLFHQHSFPSDRNTATRTWMLGSKNTTLLLNWENFTYMCVPKKKRT